MYEISPEFDADTLEYQVTVPTGTTSVTVEATRADSTASVDGDGEIEVTEGLNTIPIVVTAQNGEEKTYTLTINVEDQNPINVKVDGTDYTVVKSDTLLTAPTTFTQSSVEIDGFDIPAFVNDVIDYTLVGLKDSEGNISLYRYEDGEYTLYNELTSKSYTLVPTAFAEELDYLKTTVEINGVTMDAYRYDEDSPLVIINALDLETGKEDFYLYDPASGAAVLFDDSFIKSANQTIEYYTYVIIAFGGALFLMLILIFVLLHSTKKKQKKINQFIEKQEAKIEATRKLNDVVSEVKKITEEEKKKNEEVIKVEEVHVQSEEPEQVEKDDISEKEVSQEEIKKSKKELKKEKKEAKRKAREEKKLAKEAFFQEEIENTQKDIEEVIKSIDEDTGVYDIFEDDRKKKKKK